MSLQVSVGGGARRPEAAGQGEERGGQHAAAAVAGLTLPPQLGAEAVQAVQAVQAQLHTPDGLTCAPAGSHAHAPEAPPSGNALTLQDGCCSVSLWDSQGRIKGRKQRPGASAP